MDNKNRCYMLCRSCGWVTCYLFAEEQQKKERIIMKSEFWATVVACIATSIIVLIVWLLFEKPNITDTTTTSMIGCLAIIALYYSIRNDLLKKEE